MHIVSIYAWKTSLEKCYVCVQDRNKCLLGLYLCSNFLILIKNSNNF